VAGILAEMRLDLAAVVAGLLRHARGHARRRARIKRLFGEEVGFLVEGLTKIARSSSARRANAGPSFRKMLVAM
jgi:(p)ppGpp synthase/HD superfamily hydrolase